MIESTEGQVKCLIQIANGAASKFTKIEIYLNKITNSFDLIVCGGGIKIANSFQV